MWSLRWCICTFRSFFFQAEDGIRVGHVTGVQTCALPILGSFREPLRRRRDGFAPEAGEECFEHRLLRFVASRPAYRQIGRASCRETGWGSGGHGAIEKKKG